MDTNQLENEFLLKAIAHSEATALSRPASDFVRRNAQLGKLGTVATLTVTDESGKQKLQEDVASMQDRMRTMQEQVTAFMRERTALQDQVGALAYCTCAA